MFEVGNAGASTRPWKRADLVSKAMAAIAIASSVTLVRARQPSHRSTVSSHAENSSSLPINFVRIWNAHRGRHRKVGQGSSGGQHQGRVMRANTANIP